MATLSLVEGGPALHLRADALMRAAERRVAAWAASHAAAPPPDGELVDVLALVTRRAAAPTGEGEPVPLVEGVPRSRHWFVADGWADAFEAVVEPACAAAPAEAARECRWRTDGRVRPAAEPSNAAERPRIRLRFAPAHFAPRTGSRRAVIVVPSACRARASRPCTHRSCVPRSRVRGAHRAERGFSLVEIAIVLVILGLLLAGTLVPLGPLRDARLERAAHDAVEAARRALLAHALTHDALPCPLAPGNASAAGRCAAWRGGLPATSLGLAGPVDASGAALDPWDRPLLYALSDADADGAGTAGAPDWSVPGEASAVGVRALRGTLTVCRTAGRGRCPAQEVRADDLVFVVLSHGSDASASGLQARNASSELGAFTLAPRSSVDPHRFDDVLGWGSRGELVLTWLRAGRWR